MSTLTTPPAPHTPHTPSPSNADLHAPRAGRRPGRGFFALAALALIACALVGFQFFYFHGQSYPGRDIPPPIRAWILTHASLMTAWLGLFLVQPLLIALRLHKAHMALGKVGAVLALGILATGIPTAVVAMRLMPPDAIIWGMTPRQFFAVPFLTVLFFAACVGAAVWQRKKPERHRALMLMGTLAAASAAFGRMDALSNLYMGTVWQAWFGPFLFTCVLGLLLVIVRAAWARRFEPAMFGAWLLMTGFFVGLTRLAVTPAWDAFAAMLIK